MDEEEKLRAQLEMYRQEHQDLDEAIERLMEQPIVDQLSMQRMKKRKLVLRDIVAKIESMLIPDMPA